MKLIVDEYMEKVPQVAALCERCLKTERWQGSIVLMVLDAAFTSVGLNYFTVVVPKVKEFFAKFVGSGEVKSLSDLSRIDVERAMTVWRNRRSWDVAKKVALRLVENMVESDRLALRQWAACSNLEEWRKDTIGSISGVGLVTYQYLRMMGGIDTLMPDKLVKKVINGILVKAGEKPVNDNLQFIKRAEHVARECGYKPIELCWMTWLVQTEKGLIRMQKYEELLSQI